MTVNSHEFGDTIPPSPTDSRQYDSPHGYGRFAYGLRSVLIRLFHPRREIPPLPQKDMIFRLLVVQLERIGDLVLCEPALRALRLRFPHAERTMLAPESGSAIYGGSGWGEIITPVSLSEIRRKYNNFDLVVDFTGRVEIGLARSLFSTRIPVRIGLDRAGRGSYFTHPVKAPDLTVSTRNVYLSLAERTGAIPEDDIPRLPCGEDRLERGRQAWRELELQSPAVVLPGAYYTAQQWSMKGFSTVAQVLQRKELDVAVITGPGEERLGRELTAGTRIPHVSSPSMTELMDLLATARVVVCNNTGPLHLAAALGIPTVSTMGPTVPWRWWPKSDAPCIVFRGGSQEARGYLDQIDPLEVAAATLHLAESD